MAEVALLTIFVLGAESKHFWTQYFEEFEEFAVFQQDLLPPR